MQTNKIKKGDRVMFAKHVKVSTPVLGVVQDEYATHDNMRLVHWDDGERSYVLENWISNKPQQLENLIRLAKRET